jgi:hypothetical protein
MRQNHVLLGLVETVNFVNEQDGTPLVHSLPVTSLGYNPAKVGHPGGYGADRFKVGLSFSSYQTSQGRLAGSRRAPKDEGRQTVGGYGPAQHPVLSKDVFLTNKVVKGTRAHSFCKRGCGIRLLLSTKIEQ